MAMRFAACWRRWRRFCRWTYCSCCRAASFSRWRRLASSMLRDVSVSFIWMRAAVPLPVRNIRVRLPRLRGTDGVSSPNRRMGAESPSVAAGASASPPLGCSCETALIGCPGAPAGEGCPSCGWGVTPASVSERAGAAFRRRNAAASMAGGVGALFACSCKETPSACSCETVLLGCPG